MLKDFTIGNLLDLNETMAAKLFEGKTYPWEALPEIGDFILELGKTLDPEEFDCKDGNVWIAKSAVVAPTALINGPAIIGRETEVRHCAFIRGNALVGDGCVVGNSTELKNVVLFNKVQVPHYNYVGDSVLGFITAEYLFKSLPGTLLEAVECLEKDEVICGALGEHVLSQYVEGKEKEWDAYRTHVSKWEIDRYIVMY